MPAIAQGVGEVIVRDFGRFLARRYPRRALVGVSQGAFFVDTFLAEGFNAVPGGGRVFGHAITVDGNGNWMAINKLAGAGPQDAYLRPNGRPLSYGRILRRPRTDPVLVDVANYTDFYRLRAGLTDGRRPPRGVRRYDWPSPHQSFSPEAVFGGLRLQRRRRDPAQPAALPALPARAHARRGARLAAAPRGASRSAPARRPAPASTGCPAWPCAVPRTDALAQPLGGVRFPELDLPLGRLEPVSLSPSVTTSAVAVCGNSGGYQPLSAGRRGEALLAHAPTWPATGARSRARARRLRAARGPRGDAQGRGGGLRRGALGRRT